eukprot:4373048-Pyramimonas_sp.AAC.1
MAACASAWMPTMAALEVDATHRNWQCADPAAHAASGQGGARGGACPECRHRLQGRAAALLDAAIPQVVRILRAVKPLLGHPATGEFGSSPRLFAGLLFAGLLFADAGRGNVTRKTEQ